MKSITVNIATPEGQDIVRELAKTCDVMMENYKVGDLKRYRLDYESIKAVNPGIIYCQVKGFGDPQGYGRIGHFRLKLGFLQHHADPVRDVLQRISVD